MRFFAILIFLTALAVQHQAVASEQSVSSTFGGSYKNLLFHSKDTTGTSLTTDLNRLRLTWDGSLSLLSWYAAYDHELRYGDLISSPDYQAVANLPEPTWIDAMDRISDGGRHDWRHSLHRGWLRLDAGNVQLTVGRQRIAWGTGRIWNPTDRFNPVDPTALEPDEKTGVDSLFAEYRYSGFGAVQFVSAPGKASHDVSRKLAFRVRDTFGETDVSMTAGKIGVERVLGGDVAANIFDGTFRVEAMQAWPKGGKAYAQASVGYDYTLSNDVFPDGLYLLAEYFYNGAPGTAPNLEPVDRLYSLARHAVGLSAGYDITPLWRVDGTVIWDANDNSRFFLPSLNWSAAENLDIILFALLFDGKQASEFGRRNNLYALQLELFF